MDIITLHRVLDAIKENKGLYALLDKVELIGLEQENLILCAEDRFRADIVRNNTDILLNAVKKALPEREVNGISVCDKASYGMYRSLDIGSVAKIDPQKRFENFKEHVGNRLAVASARAVVACPGIAFNPLFIYSKEKLGKSHLLQAIANEARTQHSDWNVVFVNGKDYINEILAAILTGRDYELRVKHRSADLFIFDDIHLICRRDTPQEEFYETFNALFKAKKQIVLSSDRPPEEMSEMHDRIRCRLKWGLVCDIKSDDEVRTEWIMRLAKEFNLGLTEQQKTFLMELEDYWEIRSSLVQIKAENEFG